MTLSTKIEVFTDFTFVRSGPSYTAVARPLCVSWAFLLVAGDCSYPNLSPRVDSTVHRMTTPVN